jgi:hypothetical protein
MQRDPVSLWAGDKARLCHVQITLAYPSAHLANTLGLDVPAGIEVHVPYWHAPPGYRIWVV